LFNGLPDGFFQLFFGHKFNIAKSPLKIN